MGAPIGDTDFEETFYDKVVNRLPVRQLTAG